MQGRIQNTHIIFFEISYAKLSTFCSRQKVRQPSLYDDGVKCYEIMMVIILLFFNVRYIGTSGETRRTYIDSEFKEREREKTKKKQKCGLISVSVCVSMIASKYTGAFFFFILFFFGSNVLIRL